MLSDISFILATLMWCQKLELRTLWMYAAAVTTTAILKSLWDYLR